METGPLGYTVLARGGLGRAPNIEEESEDDAPCTSVCHQRGVPCPTPGKAPEGCTHRPDFSSSGISVFAKCHAAGSPLRVNAGCTLPPGTQ